MTAARELPCGPCRGRMACLLILLGLAAGPASAERPRVGLALSGGGAKGGAHVGVLEVLEDLRVPIDYIAGTSIGAVIGGLYASGLSAAELERALLEADWDDLLRDEPNRRDLSFRRKEDDARYLIDLELGLGRRGLIFPSGLISGQKLFFMLQSNTLPVSDLHDFDRLPIPFRAVATDLESGEMVVMGSGSLAAAIHASMAVPGVFSAVERDGRLLVDGGLVNNVPVDIVREMGADVVIAVDLGEPPSGSDLSSLVDVLQQTIRIIARPATEQQLKRADVVMQPVVELVSTGFHRIGETIALGAAEARAHAAELEALALAPAAYRQHREDRRAPETRRERVGFVRIEGNERVDTRIIRNRVRLEPGSELDAELLADDLTRVYGLGDFERVDFDLEQREEEVGVVIHAREKPWGPNYLHFGLNLDSDLDGETNFGVLANLTLTRLNRLGGELRNDLLLGSDRGLLSELYQPLDFSAGWFVAPRIDFTIRSPGFYVDGREVAELEVRRGTVAFDLGYQMSKYGELRLGVERGVADVRVTTGSLPDEVIDDLDLTDIDFGALVFQAAVDRLDSATIPQDGGRALVRAFLSREELGADRDYDRYEGELSVFEGRGRHTGFVALEGGWSEGDLPTYDDFTLGGLGSLSGFAELELRGAFLGVARGGYYYRLTRSLFVGGWLELGNVWERSGDIGLDDTLFAATAAAALETFLGPLYLAYGVAEQGNSKFYLVLGRSL